MFGFKRSMVQAVAVLSWALNYYTFDNLFLWSLITTLLAVAVLLAITTYDHDYWKDRGVFSPPAWPVVGHILSVVRFKEQGGMCFKRIYETYRNVRFLGECDLVCILYLLIVVFMNINEYCNLPKWVR